MHNSRYKLISDKFREFFWPTLAMSMANNIALFVDSVLVSAFLGIGKMPAIQLCFPVVAFVNMFYWMIGLGGSLQASNHIADHDREKASRFFSVSLFTMAIFGIIVTTLGTVFSGAVISLLCKDATLTGDVADYYGVMVFGLPLLCLIMTLSYFVRADGKPKIGFQAILISNSVNLCMDIFLIKICGLGLKGAALATIIGYICGTVYMLRYILSKDRRFKFVKPIGRFYLSDVRDISVSGFPTASSQLYITLRTQILNWLITVYGGSIGLQTFSIYSNSLFLCYIIFIGTAQTLSPIVSVYAHEGDYDRARFVLKRSVKIVLSGAVVLGLVFAVFPQFILFLYNVKDPDAVNAVTRAIRMYVFSYPGLAFFYIMSYYFQAIKKQKLSAVITALEGFVFPVSFIALLAPMSGMNGVWTGIIITETVSALTVFICIYFAKRSDKNGQRTSFLLPAQTDENRYEFTVQMAVGDVVRLSEKASTWLCERTDRSKANRTCLALEEMLTGIVKANPQRDDVIDVVLRSENDEIVISIRDMGEEFNPTVYDKSLEYSFDNTEVLNKIAKEIRYDRSLGMNSTLIRIS